MKNTKDKWIKKWEKSDTHFDSKKENFKTITNYLKTPPKRMLEIGCGMAYESEMFFKEHGTEIWLLDGDFVDGQSGSDVNFNKTADKFNFYSKIDDLKKSYEKRGMKYNFVDAKDINIPEDVKFDIICSFKSCGFHYPATTYKDLISKHSHERTKVIFDIRTDHSACPFEKQIKVINVLSGEKKCHLMEIEYE
jgi:hypothetical protein